MIVFLCSWANSAVNGEIIRAVQQTGDPASRILEMMIGTHKEKIMSPYFIRRLTQADEHFLWEMLYDALHVPEGHAPFPKEVVNEPEISKYVLHWGKEGDKGFVAVDELTLLPVGAAWVRVFTAENKGYGYIDDETPELSIGVLPEYREKGIGTDLLNHLIEEARFQHRALSLSVSSDNPAIRLYQRLGFEIVEQCGASLTMKKQLDDPDRQNTA